MEFIAVEPDSLGLVAAGLGRCGRFWVPVTMQGGDCIRGQLKLCSGLVARSVGLLRTEVCAVDFLRGF